jgi:hypothetical protein
VTDYGQKSGSAERNSFTPYAGQPTVRNKTGSPKSLTTYSWREPMVST